MLIKPRYGTGSLADLVPSILGALRVRGEADRIGLDLDGVRRVGVLLIDGLGAELLNEHASTAPFMAAADTGGLTAGFPSTTATSLSSIGSGVPSGQHGVVGYLQRVPGHERLMNPLQWALHGPGPDVDLLKSVVPEEFQPVTTAFERAAAAGVAVTRVGPSYQRKSGLTRAGLRGGEFRPSYSMGDLADGVLQALGEGDRALVYGYHGELDLTGHVRGPGSSAWRLELAQVDVLVRSIAERLPADAALIVTADHGMVRVESTTDYDESPRLRAGVQTIGGEPRARHVYVEQGAAVDVAAAWRDELGDQFDVVERDDAIERGWFGPVVRDEVVERIGEVVVVATGSGAIIRSAAEPSQSKLVGHHGSLTPAELNVPLLVFR